MTTETNYYRLLQQEREYGKVMREFWQGELAKARQTIQVLAREIRRQRLHPDIQFLNQN